MSEGEDRVSEVRVSDCRACPLLGGMLCRKGDQRWCCIHKNDVIVSHASRPREWRRDDEAAPQAESDAPREEGRRAGYEDGLAKGRRVGWHEALIVLTGEEIMLDVPREDAVRMMREAGKAWRAARDGKPAEACAPLTRGDRCLMPDGARVWFASPKGPPCATCGKPRTQRLTSERKYCGWRWACEECEQVGDR